MKNTFKIIDNHLFTILLGIIVIIAVGFRFYQFPYNPPSLNWDEVSIAYNAHSLLETGRDEYGIRFPLTFRSFDDYKMPIYIYLTAISQLIFGYSDFSVRFTAAFFGVLTIIITFFLVAELTKKKEVGLIASLLLAVLPWHVQFTRYGLEASVGLFFILFGLLLFIYGIKKSSWYLVGSSILFSLSMFTYLSFRIITPLLVFVLLFYFWKRLPKKSIALLAFGIFLCTILFAGNQIISEKGNVRFSGVSVFNNPEKMQSEYKRIEREGSLGINISRRLFHNPEIFINAGLFARGYLVHFSPDYLFFDIGPFHFAPDAGLLYLWMVILTPIGGFYLLKKYPKDAKFIFFVLLFIAPITSAATYDVPHPIRSILLLFPCTVFSAIAVWELYMVCKSKSKLLGIVFACVCIAVLFFSSWRYMRLYSMHLRYERIEKWMYGRKELVQYLETVKDGYEKIIVSPRVEWPYIFFLYYSRFDPALYLQQGGTKSGSWESEDNAFGSYEFRNIKNEDKNEGVLFVDTPTDLPPELQKEYIIKNPDGTDALYVFRGDRL